jgi:hypothetical protein
VPCPLLGHDLLTKVRAHIHFEPDGIKVIDGQGQPLQVLTMSLEDEHHLFSLWDPPPKPIEWSPEMTYWIQTYPQAWAEIAGVGLVEHRVPVIVEINSSAQPIRVHQYPMSSEARRGIAPHINRLLEAGILWPCRSAWNTPLLPVKKPRGKDYRPVQDLREVNKRVEDIHPTVPNPYTLLSHLSPPMFSIPLWT